MLKESGVIERTVSLVNLDLLGLKVHVVVQVSMDRQNKANLESFEENVSHWPEVKSCYLMTGDYDYLLQLDLLDLDSFKTFLEEKLTEQPGVSNINSSFSLKKVVDRVGVDFELINPAIPS
jgi:Lrp/AsnC family leucine-responsive transcriptional regulator